jgi:hypothetical protein
MAISDWSKGSLLIGHWSLVIAHWSLVIEHSQPPKSRPTELGGRLTETTAKEAMEVRQIVKPAFGGDGF